MTNRLGIYASRSMTSPTCVPRRSISASATAARMVRAASLTNSHIAISSVSGYSASSHQLSWKHAMSKRSLSLAIIASLVGLIGIVPATARNIAPRVIVRPSPTQGPVQFHHFAQRQVGLPMAIWPYLPLIDTTPVGASPVEADAPANPYVIIISGRPQAPVTPPTPPDYGYPPGCHAFPDGYHCDIDHSGAAP